MTRLKEIRNEKGLTQAQLAEESGVSLKTIQGYEYAGSGKSINGCSIDKASKLAAVLECNIEDLLDVERYSLYRFIDTKTIEVTFVRDDEDEFELNPDLFWNPEMESGTYIIKTVEEAVRCANEHLSDDFVGVCTGNDHIIFLDGDGEYKYYHRKRRIVYTINSPSNVFELMGSGINIMEKEELEKYRKRNRLKEIRNSWHMTVEALSKYTGISVDAINEYESWENGEMNSLPASVIYTLADALRVQMEELMADVF